MRVPIYFEGDLTMNEIAAIFTAAGYHLRTEGGRVIAARVPRFLAKPPAPTVVEPDVPDNVVAMPAKLRRARS